MVNITVDREIILREFTLDDAGAVFETVTANYDHLKTFMHWVSPEYSLDSARQFISQAIASAAARESLSLGIFRDTRFIGSIGFVNFDWLAKRTEIGYWISKDQEGNGIVGRSTERLIRYAFAELELNRIEIRCSTANLRSAAIPARLGFKLEGVLREAEFRDGKLHDFNIYGLLAGEWRESG